VGVIAFGVLELLLRIVMIRVLRIVVFCTAAVCMWIWTQVAEIGGVIGVWFKGVGKM
jgi:hypothetical protein